MNKTLLILLFIFLFTITITISCRNDKKILLTKTWRIDAKEMKKVLEETYKAEDTEEQLETEKKIRMRLDLLEKASITFKPDGKFEQKVDTFLLQGTWSLTPDEMYILKKIENMGEQKLQIIELGNDKLVFKYNEKSDNINLIWIPSE